MATTILHDPRNHYMIGISQLQSPNKHSFNPHSYYEIFRPSYKFVYFVMGSLAFKQKKNL